ncbi:type II secretion system F family protein [Amycolatopsis sp. BJA-103]|uniref:type II secretion system F family protein n=1 Tax=Amycolatopsis sp. BJA-103 TaxID=1911175 RepID=UPI000C77153B|nr:type II secretion system F family protein [Amycolatopsis sp. BJA-103]AUI62190.1 type II secretion system protein [Amycolatopsis sp. BJA-103]PNE20509.1 type II secretion system protein [Amycolatopsis sp. BJA-103]
MSPWFLLSCGAGLACWPRPTVGTPFAWRLPQAARAGWWPLPALLVLPVLGIGWALATLVLTVTVRQEHRRRAQAKAALAEAELTASVLRTMIGELRAGAHPVTAAEAVAEAVPAASGRLRGLIATARLGGETADPDAPPALANVWALANRFGLPMADVLEAARRDAEAEIGFRRRLKAKMAGPRASAAVLAVLPLVCLLLGEAMGAGPVRVLTGTGTGQWLLVVGSGLIWAGTAWCRALTGRVAPC